MFLNTFLIEVLFYTLSTLLYVLLGYFAVNICRLVFLPVIICYCCQYDENIKRHMLLLPSRLLLLKLLGTVVTGQLNISFLA